MNIDDTKANGLSITSHSWATHSLVLRTCSKGGDYSNFLYSVLYSKIVGLIFGLLTNLVCKEWVYTR